MMVVGEAQQRAAEEVEMRVCFTCGDQIVLAGVPVAPKEEK